MFLIKSILLVIVNKKPHFKKVLLLIFQFPSPLTLNNWLSHLLNLYSFVIYLYSSSIHFCVCLLIFFFLLFYFIFIFIFYFSFHKATWSRRMAAAAHFGLFRPKLTVLACFDGRFGRNWHVLVAVSALLVPVSTGIGSFWPKKKKKGRVGASDAEHASQIHKIRQRLKINFNFDYSSNIYIYIYDWIFINNLLGYTYNLLW